MGDLIERAKAALEGATPGPWRLRLDRRIEQLPDDEGDPAQCVYANGFDLATCWGGYNAAESDAALVALAPDLARLAIAAERLAEALVWASGSQDFQKGGVAEEGWRNVAVPALAAFNAARKGGDNG